MRVHALALACATLLWLAACSGGNSALAPAAPDRAATEIQQTFEQSLGGIDFTLTTFSAPGGGVDAFSVAPVAGNANELLVSVSAARGLRAWALDADYDPAAHDPITGRATQLLAAGTAPAAAGALEFSHLAHAGCASLSQALIHASSQPGFTGGGELARLRFAQRPFSSRAASAAPVGVPSQTVVTLNNATRELSWGYYSQGDYDQNRETNAADLRGIAENFRKSGNFAADSIEAVVDSDSNKEINAADLKGIAENFQRLVAGYRIYVSSNVADIPGNTEASTISPVAEVLFETAAGDPRTHRLRFSHTLAALPNLARVWVRPFDGTHEGAVSNSVQYNAPNQAPRAELAADLLLGPAPLAVTLDAGASSDPDGSIIKYEFDYDGSGTDFDWVDNGPTATVAFTYSNPGSYLPSVRITDNSAAQATATLAAPIVVETPPLPVPPVAVFSATPLAGAPPLDVDFDGSASSDSDGSVVQWEWDWETDGVYDETSAAPTAGHTYTALGAHTVTLRVTDDDGLTDTASRTITVTNGGVAPTARLTNDATLGEAPMTVNFDASTSTDADGSIVLYEWDWEYAAPDFTADEASGATPTISHQFATGSMDPTIVAVRVTDNDGQTHVAVNYLNIYPNGDYAPRAYLTATPRYGAVPVNITFDATASFDIDGTIAKYEWDWEGDGTYDHDSGPIGIAAHLYTVPGVFDAAVRLTDNEGFTSVKIMLVLPTVDSTFPPDDSIFALPSQSKAAAGEVVTIEVHTKGAASPFQYMNGCGITFEAGNMLAPGTVDCGAIDAISDTNNVLPIDGLWPALNPVSFIWFGEGFLFPTDVGGGRVRYDFNVTPLGATAVSNATGAMFNFGVTVNSSLSFSFERFNGVNRTYYSASAGDRNWGSDDNAGLPGVTML